MYRYLDPRGQSLHLTDDMALRDAIADGRIRRVTPFAEGNEPFVMAGKHPAYIRHAEAPSQAAGPLGLFRDQRYQKFMKVTGPLLALALGIYSRRGDFTRDHDQFVQAVSQYQQGDSLPAALLTSPPSRESDKVTWVAITAAHDTEQQMLEAETRFGVTAEPADWMQPAYLVHPSRYPHVARYFVAMERFHTSYRDSVVPMTERALRSRAAQAGLPAHHLDALISETLYSSRQVTMYFNALSQWAREGRRLHDVLVAAEPDGIMVRGTQVFMPHRYAKEQYDRTIKRIAELEERRDAIELSIQRNTRPHIAGQED